MTDEIDDAVVEAAWDAWHDEYPNAARAMRAAIRAAVLAEREAWNAFSAHKNWSIEFKRPVFCDDDDQECCWVVYEETGPINDREWEIIGKGDTVLDAIADAIRARRNGGSNGLDGANTGRS